MTTVSLSRGAWADVVRLTRFLLDHEPEHSSRTPPLVLKALRILEHHPWMGRPVEHPLRELVVSRGRSGYLALYEYDEPRDEVIVHAIRHQREVGYQPH